jgi:putative transposase
MSRSRHTEAQIIAALKQVEAGRTTEDVAREQGVSKHTIYAWKSKYGGMEVSEAEEVKHLRERAAEEAGCRAEPGQGHAAVGDPKKLPRLVERRTEVRRLLEEFRASERLVCEPMAVPRSSGRYRSRRDDSRIQERLRELAREHPRFGYRRLHLYLQREMGVNHKKVQRVYREKKVQRVYRELGLSVKRTRRWHLRRTLAPRAVLTAPNQECCNQRVILSLKSEVDIPPGQEP